MDREALEELKTEPDYCYDPENWEFTSLWVDRDMVHGEGEGLIPGEVLRIATLIKGPDKFVALIPGATDEDASEIEWFDTEAEAQAAIAALQSGGSNAKLDRDMDDYGPEVGSDT